MKLYEMVKSSLGRPVPVPGGTDPQLDSTLPSITARAFEQTPCRHANNADRSRANSHHSGDATKEILREL